MKKLLILFCMIILVGNVSAFEFDNTLKYEEDDMKVTIENFFGLPIFGDDLGTIELKSHESVDEVLKFGFGKEEVVMYYDFTNWELYEDGLGEVEFTDKRTGEIIEKDYYFVEWVEKDIEVNDYIEVCNLSKNGTNECVQEISGTHLEKIWGWGNYTGKDIPNKNIRIGLKTYVDDRDYIDGVWTIAGKKIERHAEWTASLNVNLRSYWTIDEPTGTINDSLGVNNGTVTGATQDQPGIINRSISFDGNTNNINFGNLSDFGSELSTEIKSVSLWFNTTDTALGYIFGIVISGTNQNFQLALNADSSESSSQGRIYFSLRDSSNSLNGGVNSDLGYTDGDWHHLVAVVDEPTQVMKIYLDGDLKTFVYANQNSLTMADFNTGFMVGARNLGGAQAGIQALVDEMGIWDRELSQAEVTQLYNSGVGITWTDLFSPNVTLNSPVDNFNSSNTTINFNGSVVSLEGITNVSLIINDTYIETNSSGINDSNYLFTSTLAEGTHNWTYESCNDVGCKNETRTINIDSVIPFINLTYPIGIINYHILNTNLSLNWSINDVNLDSCWYDYNGTNITVTCADNTTNINTTNQNNKNVTFWANDTFGNLGYNFTEWEYILLEDSQTFNPTAAETSIETFNISLFYTASNWNSISAELNYDEVNYSGTQYGSGDNPKFYANIEIPAIDSASENKTFFWYITLINTTGIFIYNSTSNNQNISEIGITINCGVGDIPYLRFDTKNAENPFPDLNATFKSSWDIKILGGVGESANFSFEDITEVNNTWEFCISPNSSNYTISVDVEVDATGFAKNFYYITEANYISNQTSNISLYLLNDSLASPTILRVLNKATTRLANVLISIQLYDVGTDIFYTVGMGKTNENGEDVVYLNWFDSLYKFVLVQNGETILITNTTKVFETPKLFEIDTDLVFSYDKFRDFQYSLNFNNVTNNFVLTFVKPSALVEQGCLRTIKRTASADIEICKTCTESASATLYCNINGQGNGTFISTFYATGSLAVIDWISEPIGLSTSEEIYDLLDKDDSAFYTILFSLLVVVMFVFSPIFGIIGLIMGLLGANVLGFTSIEYQTFLGIVIIGGGIVWLIKR